MYALTFKDKILYRGSYREVLDHCFILRKEQGYLLSDPRYKLIEISTTFNQVDKLVEAHD